MDNPDASDLKSDGTDTNPLFDYSIVLNQSQEFVEMVIRDFSADYARLSNGMCA